MVSRTAILSCSRCERERAPASSNDPSAGYFCGWRWKLGEDTGFVVVTTRGVIRVHA